MKKYIILLLISLIVLISPVYATNFVPGFNIEKSNSGSLKVGDTVTITIMFANIYDGVSFTLDYDKNVYDIVSNETSKSWEGNYNDLSNITLTKKYQDNETGDLTTVLKVKSISGSGNLTYKNIKNNNGASAENIYMPVTLQESNTYLKNVTFSSGTLSPAFNYNNTNYTLNVDSNITSLNVSATTSSSLSKVLGTGNISIANKNFISLIVTSEGGTTREYKFKINRATSNISNTYLKKIIPSTGTINFNKNTFSYNINVSNSVTTMTFDVETESSLSTYKITGNKNLSIGTNTFEINVTSNDGASRKYIINVIQSNSTGSTSDNYLSKLEVLGYDLSFNKDVLNYVLKVNNLDDLIINAEANSSESNITIQGNENLHNGSIVSIIVSNSNNNNRIYTIEILKNDDISTYWKNNQKIIRIVGISLICLIITALIIRKITKKNKNFYG